MVVYTTTGKKTLAANQTDIPIVRITPAVDEKITILEIAYSCPTDGKMAAYVGEVKVDDVDGTFLWDANHPIVVNREVQPGQTYKVSGTSITAGDFKYLIVYDKVPV